MLFILHAIMWMWALSFNIILQLPITWAYLMEYWIIYLNLYKIPKGIPINSFENLTYSTMEYTLILKCHLPVAKALDLLAWATGLSIIRI